LKPEKLALLAPGQIKKFVSDTDGTFSTLREGWEGIMGPMMVEMIIGKAEIDQDDRGAIERVVADYIHESTGINTILQMARLVGMVKEYGLVPAGQILDDQGYKAEYNRRLMVPVGQRLNNLARRGLKLTDVTMYGALQFVQLASKSVDIHVFSGTDDEDVRKELAAIGIAPHVKSIHGALREYKDSNKEMVLRKLMTDFGLLGPQVAVIGDGKVELQVGAEAGCITIGIASNEVLGYSWNLKKVERLAPYADILTSDFRYYHAIMRLLKLA
jgi:phosphoglycolate phosphatase-like HAD superfamily hydrolase